MPAAPRARWQIRDSEGGGRHVDHDAQLTPRLQDSRALNQREVQAKSTHARDRDGAMRLACRDLDAFEPGIELGEREAALCERCRRWEMSVFKPLVQSAKPVRSRYKHLTLVRSRPTNTNKLPEAGFWASSGSTRYDNVSIDLRMSTGSRQM